ncbi:hypothetical protein [Dickeya poaceiphila]|uniref:Circularly permuted type 2 ATP-grasp protein n=1 Tax=Dickeya poaceiphila TaxID=568768 RepID=A0A5B8IAN6_9GAMM|nr:hypothetical protein [Dickeya poaceiphila]QDX29917.1 circularly permuted type 2 ATP-grasp protein [Dickeya poaceiphila]
MKDITNQIWSNFICDFPNEITNTDTINFKIKTAIRGRSYYYPPTILNHLLRDEIEKRSLQLNTLITSIPHFYFDGNFNAWIDYLGYDDYESHFLKKFTSEKFQRRALLFMRPDFILTDNGIRLCEVNVAATIGGMSGNINYIDSFQKTIFFEHISCSKKFRLHFDHPESHWQKALHSTLANSVSHTIPVLFEAIASALDKSPMRKSFIDMAESAGFKVISGIIQELDIRTTGVFIDNIRIDIVYTRFTWGEIKKYVPFDILSSLAEADENGLVDFISPPLYTLYDNKKNLVLLSSKRDKKIEKDLAEIITETIPLDDTVKQKICEEKNNWVIKPSSEYGGKGVCIGSETSDNSWKSLIETILSAKISYVAQRKINRTSIFTDPSGQRYVISAGGMVFNGHFAGVYLRRLSIDSEKLVINGAQGAECAPAVFFTEE